MSSISGVDAYADRLPRVSARAVTYAATFAWGVGLAFVSAVHYERFGDRKYDLGNYVQAIWSTAHGHFLDVTEVGGTQVSRLGIHVDPIIIVFAPLWRIWPSPVLLLVCQAVALAVGALPLFWLGQKHLPRERDAAFLATAYLLCPNVGWSAVADFHPVCFAVPSLLFAMWYLDESRYLPFALFAGAAVLCQEQIGLLVGCVGLWHAWRHHKARAGIVIAAAGFGVSSFDFFVVIHHFSGGSPFAARFGGSPSDLIRDAFTHPLRIIDQIDVHDLKGLLLAVPVLGACFGSSILLAAAPQLVMLFLSRRSNDWLGINVLLVVPFVYAAALFTLARAKRNRIEGRGAWLSAKHVFAMAVVVAAVIGPFGVYGISTALSPRATSVLAQRHALSLVPESARVSATNHLAPPLSARRYIYVFPVLRDADWALVDSSDDELPNVAFLRHRSGISVDANELSRQSSLMRHDLEQLQQNQGWKLVYHSGDVYAFRKTTSVSQ
jgi:uncharacterized membrane protein